MGLAVHYLHGPPFMTHWGAERSRKLFARSFESPERLTVCRSCYAPAALGTSAERNHTLEGG